MVKGRFRGEALRWWSAWLVHAAAAAVLMAPAFLIGTWNADSFIHNVAWVDGVAAEMAQGFAYPRWLTTGFEGMGSPSFYFYPPLPFLIMGAAKLFVGHLVSTNAILQIYAFVALAASGLAMWGWLRRETNPGAALLGSLAYVTMPYHLAEHYLRGAAGELTAYAILPLLLVSIRRACRREGGGLPGCSLAYAALIFAHLPSALLVSLFVIPVYACWLLGFRREHLASYAWLAGAFTLGLMLSAIYLVPALSLQHHISAHFLWDGHYGASRWLIWNILDYPDPRIRFLLLSYLALAGGLLAAWTAVNRQAAGRREIGFFLVWTLSLLLILLGAIPPLWNISLLASVQFPWRMLLIVDALWIYAATLMLTAAGSARAALPLAIAFGASTLASALLFIQMSLAGEAVKGQGDFLAGEPLEYLPAGITARADLRPDEGGVIPPSAGSVDIVRENGQLHVHVRTQAPATIILPIYYFPAWQVYAAERRIESGPSTPARLLSFHVGSVNAAFTARRTKLPAEQIGLYVSLASLSVLLLGACWRTIAHMRGGLLWGRIPR